MAYLAILDYIVATFRIYERRNVLIYKAFVFSVKIFEPEGYKFKSCQARHNIFNEF